MLHGPSTNSLLKPNSYRVQLENTRSFNSSVRCLNSGLMLSSVRFVVASAVGTGSVKQLRSAKCCLNISLILLALIIFSLTPDFRFKAFSKYTLSVSVFLRVKLRNTHINFGNRIWSPLTCLVSSETNV